MVADDNAANGTDYPIGETDFPRRAPRWTNYPYDYWNIWINHAGTTGYMEESTLEMLSGITM